MEPDDGVQAGDGVVAASPARGRRPRSLIVASAAALLALGGGAIAFAGSGSDAPAQRDTVKIATQTAPDIEGIPDDTAGMGALPKARPKLVQPVAGAGTDDAVDDLPRAPQDPVRDPKVTGPASSSTRDEIGDPGVSNLSPTKATALPNGVALPPLEAPQAVLDVIQAGNIIARSPYKWGGGHGNFQDSGYDCSGSVTYALYYAGLISQSATSGQLMAYGKPGPGKWISIYTNPGHVYMIVAGIRFDTVARKLTGSRWQNSSVSAPGRYEVRHPAGL